MKGKMQGLANVLHVEKKRLCTPKDMKNMTFESVRGGGTAML